MDMNSRLSLLCLYGPSGSGKTRLLATMESALNREDVLRTGAESLVRDMAADLACAKMGEFRQKYQRPGILLIDNLWVLQSRPLMAAEVCRLLRDRQNAGRLTVVASDLPESEWAAKNTGVANLLVNGQAVHL